MKQPLAQRFEQGLLTPLLALVQLDFLRFEQGLRKLPIAQRFLLTPLLALFLLDFLFRVGHLGLLDYCGSVLAAELD